MNRSHGTQKSAQGISTSIIESRPDLSVILLCIDIRRNCLPMDQEAATWFISRKVPTFLVLTKIDELSKNQRPAQIRQWKDWTEAQNSPLVCGLYPVSARTGEGVSELEKSLKVFLGYSGSATGESDLPG